MHEMGSEGAAIKEPVESVPKFRWGDLDDEDLQQAEQKSIDGKALGGSFGAVWDDQVNISASFVMQETGAITCLLSTTMQKDDEERRTKYEPSPGIHEYSMEGESINNLISYAEKVANFEREHVLSNIAQNDGNQTADYVTITNEVDTIEASTKFHISMEQPTTNRLGAIQSYTVMDSNNKSSEVSEIVTAQCSEFSNSLGEQDNESVKARENEDENLLAEKPSAISHEEEKLGKGQMDIGAAASMLMNKFDNIDLGESKERFRQRLWCYLFENLNRAVDELYFLSELECDMEQINEALLVLDEAKVDFKELKDRVDGFDNVKKNTRLTRTVPAITSKSLKMEHQRPHAIAWEVRRMASSRRAGILSSSVEAMEKVQHGGFDVNLNQEKAEAVVRVPSVVQNCKEIPLAKHKSKDAVISKELGRNKSRPTSAPSSSESFRGSSMDKRLFDAIRTHQSSLSQISSSTDSSRLKESKKVERQKLAPKSSDKKPDTQAARQEPRQSTAEVSSSMVSKMEMLPMAPINSSEINSTVSKPLGPEDQDTFIKNEDKKTADSKSALEAWKEKRNWEDILSSPLPNSSKTSGSPITGRKSTERARVLHDKLMSPERKKKSPLEMKKEVDEKQARATRIRRELENERVQRLQRTTEKLNRVSEWQAVKSSKLREGMHARHQRGESRHEAHLAQIARRASDESSKVSEVRFITSLNEGNKKLSLQQKLQDSELRRAERLQTLRIKQKEDVAREEAALERRKLLEAERLQRIADTQRKKEEAQARREEERKVASAAREARAVEQVRKKEVRAKAQQEEAESMRQKLAERLRDSAARRRVYLEQIRERAVMDVRDQGSPLSRRPLSKEGQPKASLEELAAEREINSYKLATPVRILAGSNTINTTANSEAPVGQQQALKKRIKKIRQRLTARKFEFVEPPLGAEGVGIGSISVAAAARSKIGRWLQDLQRLQQARKAGVTAAGLIIAEIVKYVDGKEAELHAARQAGLLDFVATALSASHTSKPEACQSTIALLRLLLVLLMLPANRSYFLARNFSPPLIPMLATVLENYSGIGFSSTLNVQFVTANAVPTKEVDKASVDEKLEAIGEVLQGLLKCMTLVIGHVCTDEKQMQMQDDLAELLVACEVIHRMRNLFALFDRPQVEGAPIPPPVLLGLKLMETLTALRLAEMNGSLDGSLQVLSQKLPFIRSDVQTSCMINMEHLKGSGKELPNANRQEKELPFGNEDEGTKISAEENSKDIQDEPETTKEVQQEDHKKIDSSVTTNFAVNMDGMVEEKTLEMASEDVNKKKEGHDIGHGNGDEDVNVSVDMTSCKDVKKTQNGLASKRRMSNLMIAVAETGLIGLPSLLTAVLLQANPRSSPEQAASALPDNFEEVATSVLQVLNNFARLDLSLVQNMLGLPDLRMEFFHLVSFLLSYCTCKWKNATDQVASLLLETLLLLGYFGLLHPENQAVLRWGKSPTILHKICDLPFAFFSDAHLIPILVGTLLAVCYGSERNRDVIQQELSMEMFLSFFQSSKADVVSNTALKQTKSGEIIPNAFQRQSIVMEAIVEESEEDLQQVDIPTELKMGPNDSQEIESDLSVLKRSGTPNTKRAARVGAKVTMNDGDSVRESNSTKSAHAKAVRSLGSVVNIESGIAQSKKNKIGTISTSESSMKALKGILPSTAAVSASESSKENLATFALPAAFMLQKRFPICLLDAAEGFFAVSAH